MRGKKIILIVTIIVIVLLAAAGTVAGLYFFTDMLKTNDQLFAKYVSQVSGLDTILDVDNLKAQEEFKNTNSHTSTGNLSINIQDTQNGNSNFVIATNSKYDATNKRTLAEAIIKNGQEDLAKFSFINSTNVYAIKCEDVYENYIGIRNAELKKFARNLGMPDDTVAQIPDLISLEAEKQVEVLTEQDKKYLVDAYSSIITNVITADKYTKTEQTSLDINGTTYNAQGYTLTIEGNDFKTILTNVLNKARQDATTLEIINNVLLSSGVPQEAIEQINVSEIFQNISNSVQESQIGNLTITAYQSQGKLVRVAVSYDEINLTFDVVTNDESEKKVIVTIDTTDDSVVFKAQLFITKTISESGVNHFIAIIGKIDNNEYRVEMNTTMGNVINNTINNASDILVIEGNSSVDVNYEKTIQVATEPLDIQELQDSNTVIMNNYPMEQLTPFMTGVIENYGKLFENIITKLNIQSENVGQLYNYINGVTGAVVAVANTNGANPCIGIGAEIGISIAKSVYTSLTTVFDEAQSASQNMETEIFNEPFLVYGAQKQIGYSVKMLCNTVKKNNDYYLNDVSSQVKVQMGSAAGIKDPQTQLVSAEEIDNIINQIDDLSDYNVDFGYSVQGKIVAVGITEVVKTQTNLNN